MFLATDHSKQDSTELPRNCTFRESDWHILAGFWHPVAFAHDIKDKPIAAKLLDVDLDENYWIIVEVLYEEVRGVLGGPGDGLSPRGPLASDDLQGHSGGPPQPHP